MSAVNHPLLVPSIEVPIVDPIRASSSACTELTTSTSDKYLDFDLSSLGAVDGDFIVLVIKTERMPYADTGYFSDIPDGWVQYLGGNGYGFYTAQSLDGVFLFGKFYFTGDPTTAQFTVRETNARHEWCYHAYVLKGLDRRRPINSYSQTCPKDWYFSKRDDTYIVPTFTYPAPLRYSGTDPFALHIMNGSQSMTSAQSYSTPPIDFTDSANYTAPVGTNIWGSAFSVADLAGAGSGGVRGGVVSVLYQTPTNKMQNLVGSSYKAYVDSSVMARGLTLVNCERDNQALADATWPMISISGGAGDVEHYVTTGSFAVTAGQTIIARCRFGSRWSGSVNSTYPIAMALVAPSGTKEVICIPQIHTTGFWVTPSDVTPVYPNGSIEIRGQNYSGVPGSSHAECIIRQVAQESGNYSFRAILCGTSATPPIQHDAGGSAGTPIRRYQYVHEMCVGVDQFPEYFDTGAGGQSSGTYEDYMPGILWDMKDSGWGDFYWSSKYNATTAFRQVLAGQETYSFVRSGASSFSSWKLIPQMDYTAGNGGHGISSDGLGIGTDPVAQAIGEGGQSNIMYVSDHFMTPYYYANESTTTKTVGKYYFEVTTVAAASNSHTLMRVGITIPGMAKVVPENVNYYSAYKWSPEVFYRYSGATGGSDNGVTYVSSGLATCAATNDVLGVAVDYENNEISFYVNGTLQDTITMSQLDYEWVHMASVVTIINSCDLSGNLITWDANFTGPFTYTKPTGFVAADHLNEVT